MPAPSTIRITVFAGARVRWTAPGNDESLTRLQRDGAILEIDQKLAVDHEKEFVEVIVLVPVILALHHAEPYD
jgi:hypothetical protein